MYLFQNHKLQQIGKLIYTIKNTTVTPSVAYDGSNCFNMQLQGPSRSQRPNTATEAVLIKLQTSKHGLTLTADQKPTKFGEAFTNGQRHGDSIQLQVLQV